LPAAGDFARIRGSVNETKMCLNTLLESESAFPQKLQTLLRFRNEFEKSVETADVTDEEFDELLEGGTPLIDRIAKIMPHLNNYSSKKITFSELASALNPASKSRVKEESPRKEAQAESKVKMEAPPQSEKKIKAEETSLKVEEKPIKSVERISQAVAEPKSSRAIKEE
jgi:hypothetical protein